MQQIVFSDHVVIYHAADNAAAQTTLQTDSLTIVPSLQQASTKDPVTILQPDAKVHGTGMMADLKLGTIQLLSETRANMYQGHKILTTLVIGCCLTVCSLSVCALQGR